MPGIRVSAPPSFPSRVSIKSVTEHLSVFDPQDGALGNCGRRGYADRLIRSDASLAEEITGAE
jgi:hypothetical protein